MAASQVRSLSCQEHFSARMCLNGHSQGVRASSSTYLSLVKLSGVLGGQPL